jgi:hypothetical protein
MPSTSRLLQRSPGLRRGADGYQKDRKAAWPLLEWNQTGHCHAWEDNDGRHVSRIMRSS